MEHPNPLKYKMGLKGDLLITLVNGIGVIAGIFILNGVIARVMGLEALGEFLLVRRTALTLMGIFLVSLNTGLPFYVSKGEDKAYGTAALILFAMITIPLTGLVSVALYQNVIGGFPSRLAFPFFIFAAGYALQFLAYALLRGHLNMLGANLLQLISAGLIPIFVFVLLHDRSVLHLLIGMGMATLLLSAMVYLIKMGRHFPAVNGVKLMQLLSYGVQRLPSSLAYFILLGSMPLLIVADTGKAEIAYVNSGISLVRLFLVVVGPFGIVLLPRISKALAEGKKAQIARGLRVLGRTVLFIGMPASIFLSMHSSAILGIWLGSGNEAGAWIVQFIVLALPCYVLIEVLRSPIDAASARGYNSIVYGVAALALLIVFFGLKAAGLVSVVAGVISFISAYLTAAITSLYYTYKFYGINIISPWYLLIILGMTTLFFFFFYFINTLISGLPSLLIGGVSLVTILGLFFWKAPIDWVIDLRSLVMIR